MESEIRKCTKCGKEQPIIEYYKSESGRRGYACWCKSCYSKKARERYEKNAEEYKKDKNEYNKQHRKERSEYQRNYRRSDYAKEKISEYNKAYAERHPGRIKEYKMRYGTYRKRARYFGVEYEHIDRLSIFVRDKNKCQLCGRRIQVINKNKDNAAHLDHIIPLSQGGHHIESNVQALCRKCNVKKHNKMTGQLRLCYEDIS